MIKNIIIKCCITLFTLGISGLFFALIVFAYFSLSLPKLTSLSDYQPSLPSKILDREGVLLAEFGQEKREIVNFEDIPKIIIDAFLSAEDDSFYKHKGVDYFGILRAMVANIKAGRIVQGGSTITQQVAKSLLLSNKRSITRKIKDFLLARQIEKHFTKKEILFLYLNQVYLGGGYYGIKAAVKGYFGKELEEITISEAAMMAGLLVAPGRYSPYRRPVAAMRRQRYVLRRMFETRKITREEYQDALNEIIPFRKKRGTTFKAPHFSDWIRQRVIEQMGAEEFLNGGYQVNTTLDWELQELAEKSVYVGIKAIDKRQGFIGPIGHLKKEQWAQFSEHHRREIYNDKSNFFTFQEGDIKNEISLGEHELEDLEEHKRKEGLKLKHSRFIPGIMPKDPLVEHFDIKADKYYQAIVLHVDDMARIIYVSVAGVPGIIPHNNFKWAKKRIISNNKRNYNEVSRPSTIVKKGDIVLVTIEKKSRSIYSHTTARFKRYINRRKNRKIIKKQKYLLCLLDQRPEAEGALVSLSPFTGNVISFVGGVDFSKSQFNRVLQSHRQPGSAFKPILYATALEYGFKPNSIIIDSPEALAGVDQSLSWKPRNYDGKFKGPMTFRNALETSRNIPTIKIAQTIGVQSIIKYADRIGMEVATLDKDLSISLGSFGITLMSLTKTYGIFPNGGRKISSRSIVSIYDRAKNKIDWMKKDNIETENEEEIEEQQEGPPQEIDPFLAQLTDTQVYDPRLAYLMTNILRGVVLHGTGRSAKRLSTFLGGKTGTTNNYVDAWFVGFSSNLVTGVWTGFDNNKTLGMGESGSKAALPIWKKFMAGGLKKYGERDFLTPPGIINVAIDKETGKLAHSDQSNIFLESFVEGHGPTIEENEEVEESLEFSEETISNILEDDSFYNEN